MRFICVSIEGVGNKTRDMNNNYGSRRTSQTAGKFIPALATVNVAATFGKEPCEGWEPSQGLYGLTNGLCLAILKV